MIAACQLGFLGNVVCSPHDAPARRMLTACCQHKQKQGRPYLHNNDVNVKNLRLLFARTPEVIIDDYGSVKDWYREAMHNPTGASSLDVYLMNKHQHHCAQLHGLPQDDAAQEITPHLHLQMPLTTPNITTLTYRLLPLLHAAAHLLPSLHPHHVINNSDQITTLTWLDIVLSTHYEH
jgi:hypothetical protein